MKKFLLLTIVLLMLVAVALHADPAPAKSTGSKTIESLTQGKIQLTIPKVGTDVKRVVLDNGLVLYLYEDHRLPLFNATAMLRCGSAYDAAEKNGLSGLVGSVMRSGGTKNIPGDTLNAMLELMGGSLETMIGSEQGTASLFVLSKDQETGLRLLADVLRNPAFPADKLDLAKNEIKNQIKRRNDDPNRLVAMYFANTLYGDHPFGRMLDWSSIKGITVQDLVDYHQKFFAPNNIILGISGDFKSDDLIARIKQYLGDWPKATLALPKVPEVKATPHPGVFEVHKDINQAYLQIGQIGIKRDNPDRFAVDLLNYILGGGSFTSRLTSHVRSDEGLAYHVSSSFDINSRDYGTFAANCQTKSATAYKATRIIMDEIARIRKENVTPQELLDAQNSLTNRLVFSFDSGGKIIRNLMSLEFDGYPANYYESYLDNYRKVTVAELKAAAQKYLKPEQMTFIVVGKPETFDKPLTEFGKITNIEPVKPATE
jgi:zinc protease